MNENGKKIVRIEMERVTSIRDKVPQMVQITTTMRMQIINLVESRDITIYVVIVQTIETLGTPEIETITIVTITIAKTLTENEKFISRTNMRRITS